MIFQTGKIAKNYELIGGKCTYFGKPYKEHFHACLQKLGLESSRVAHIGDSLHHDIAGANQSCIPSIFITGGIHSDSFNNPIGELPKDDELQSLFDSEGGLFPTHVVPLFRF